MIYFYNDGSFRKLKQSQQSIEWLKSKYPNATICDEDDLIKRLSKYMDVYIYICPYHKVINDTDLIVWSDTEENANESYYESIENI